MTTKTVDLFDDKKITLTYDESKLTGPVGDQPALLTEFKATGGPKDVPILGQTIQVNGRLSADARVLDPQDTNLFPGLLVVPDGHVPAALSMGANLELGANANLPLGSAGLWTLALNASFESALGYRHIVPIDPTQTGSDLLQGPLLRQVMLPNLLDLRNLKQEAHQMTAVLGVNYGGQLSLSNFNQQFQYELGALGSIFDNATLKASATASLQATAGYGYHGKVVLTVSDLGVQPDGWVRIRLARQSTSKLSFGATLSLAVEQNLGAALIQVLDNVLALAPVQKGMAYLKEISTQLQAIGTGDWSALKDKLSEEATDFAVEALHIDQILASTEAAKVIGKINTFLDQYNQLESRLQGFWDQLLLNANLGPNSKVRQTLTLIANLNLDNLDATLEELVSEKFVQAIAVVEALTDASLEDLLTDHGVMPKLEQAKKAAKQALDLIENAPQDIFDAWQNWAQRQGVAGVIEWLQTNATSAANLKKAATNEIRGVVERLLDKAFDKIKPADLEQIQDWAAKASAAISSDRLKKFEDSLRTKLKRLDTEFNAKLSLEIDRETRKSQLLDILVDPQDADNRRAWDHMKKLDVFAFLADLPEGMQREDEADLQPPTYRILEALFTNTQIKSSVVSVFLSGLFNFSGTYTRRRLTEERLTIDQGAWQGHYSGTYFQEAAIKNDATWNAATSLEVTAKGSGLDLQDPYLPDPGYAFRLTMMRDDQATQTEELLAAIQLLNAFGFTVPRTLVETIPAGSHTKVAVNLSLPVDAVKAFFADSIQQWDETTADPQTESIYLPAGSRWFNTDLIDDKLDREPAGQVYAAIIRSTQYLDFWPKTTFALKDNAKNGWVISYGGRRIAVQKGLLNPVLFLQAHSKYGPGKLAEVRQKLNNLTGTLTASELFAAVEQFANACRSATPHDWDNPLFPYWLIVERLRRLGIPVDPSAGVATIRYKKDDDWSHPQTFRIS